MIKLAERKLSTENGLQELETFLKSFDFSNDVKRVKSEVSFFARLDIDTSGNYSRMRNCNCRYVIENGGLMIEAEQVDADYTAEVNYDTYIKRISFIDCIASFSSVVEKYNNEVKEKEKEIEKFLDFVNNWKK